MHERGEGVETNADLDDLIDVGLFTERPGDGAFAQENVLLMQRQPARSGKQEIRVITTERPSFAGIDPYNKYVDRNSDDNIVAVE